MEIALGLGLCKYLFNPSIIMPVVIYWNTDNNFWELDTNNWES